MGDLYMDKSLWLTRGDIYLSIYLSIYRVNLFFSFFSFFLVGYSVEGIFGLL